MFYKILNKVVGSTVKYRTKGGSKVFGEILWIKRENDVEKACVLTNNVPTIIDLDSCVLHRAKVANAILDPLGRRVED